MGVEQQLRGLEWPPCHGGLLSFPFGAGEWSWSTARAWAALI